MRRGRSGHLGHILFGSVIGAVLGLVLLAIGLALILNGLEARQAASSKHVEAAPSLHTTPDVSPPLPQGNDASGVLYPERPTGSPVLTVPQPPEPLPAPRQEPWRSIFEEEDPADRGKLARTPPVQASPVPRPAPARPARFTPRPPPEAKKQEDSLFF